LTTDLKVAEFAENQRAQIERALLLAESPPEQACTIHLH
jgi:hypothetical protein